MYPRSPHVIGDVDKNHNSIVLGLNLHHGLLPPALSKSPRDASQDKVDCVQSRMYGARKPCRPSMDDSVSIRQARLTFLDYG